MRKETIEVNGRLYELQHPGNREWLKLKQKIIKVTQEGIVTIDLVPMLDYCFEHVVFPVEGNKLNIDTMDIDEIEEVWSRVLQVFLKGKPLAESYSTDEGEIKPERRNKPEQSAVLQEESK